MDCRTNEIKDYDEVPEDEHKFLKEIPIGKVIVMNGYEYVVDRADIEKQEVILKPRGKAMALASDNLNSQEREKESKLQRELAKLKGKGGLGR
jgi:hypothetical protein